MKHRHLSKRQLKQQLLNSESQRRNARSLACATVLSLGFAASPAHAALILIDNTTVNSTVAISSGDSLQVTATGIVDVPTAIAVSNAGSGTTIGSISNAGSISSGNSDAIAINASSTVTGDITNTGSITAAFDGVFIDTHSVVQGSIINAVGGIINGGQDGIEIQESSTVVNTDIINDGTINAVVDGIQLSWGAKVNGNVVNNGTIDVGEDGIDLTASSTGPASGVGGDISNTGLILAGDDGIDINTGAVVTGAVLNSGRIETASDGVLVTDGAQVLGGITNTASGVIQAGQDGIDVSWNGAQAQAITNAGTITAVQSGIEVDSTAKVIGAITNTGNITGGFASIFIEFGSSVGAGINNSGTLSGPLGIVGSDGLGGGIDVVNSGVIDIGASESFISGDYTQQNTGTFTLTLKNFMDYLAAPMTIIGDAVLANALDFNFVPGFNPAGGQRFTLFDIGGTRTGSFANQPQDALVGIFSGVNVYIDYTAEGNIDLYTVPEPSGLALLGLGAFGWFASQRRKG